MPRSRSGRVGEVPECSSADPRCQVRIRKVPVQRLGGAHTQVNFPKVSVQKLGEVPESSSADRRRGSGRFRCRC